MRLNRRTISGTIKELNWDRVAAIGLTIGLIAVSGSMINLNSKKESIELDRYSSYSEQVEAIFDVDMDAKKEEVLDGMQQYLDIVNEYKQAETDEQKEAVISRMVETRDDLKKEALSLIKIDKAKKEGRTPEEYTIGFGDKNDGSPLQIYREVNGVCDERENLNDESQNLVYEAIYLEDLDSSNPKEGKLLAEAYEEVIKLSARYAGKTAKADKAK